MNKMKLTILTLLAGISLSALATWREHSYAIEDAAYQAVTKMDADPRVTANVKRLAFAKCWMPFGARAFSDAGSIVTVFEAALGAVPCSFDVVLHESRQDQWTLIDQVFDQAADFDSYNPASHPELGKLELCDALLLAKVIDFEKNDEKHLTSVRIAMKIISVKTAHQVWSAVIEGQYDGSEVADEADLTYYQREALEAAAKDAVAKLPPSMNGYGVLLLPIEGIGGRAMTAKVLSELTASGRDIDVYDLPNGNASDRAIGRYLWERTGSGRALDPAALKRIESRTGAKGKLAVMTGRITKGRVMPETWVDPTGKPVDRLSGSFTDLRENPTSYELVADLRFRDVTDSFRVAAAVTAKGVYARNVTNDITDQLLAFVTVRNIVVAIVILVIIWFIGKYCFRVR